MSTEDFFPLYLTIAEFDIDRGPTVRAQLPAPVPVTTSFLSPLKPPPPVNPRPMTANNSKNGGDNDDDQDDDQDDGFINESTTPNSSSSASANQRPQNWSSFLADQMMPDGSDRNSRNTSWLMLNRPDGMQSGVMCCVFQLSTAARWEPRPAILAALDGQLVVVDLFDTVRSAPSFAIPKANLEQQSYRVIGPLSQVSLQIIPALPSEKMAQVQDVLTKPPMRPKQETSLFMSAFGGGGSNSEEKEAALRASRAFAYFRRGGAEGGCSVGVAFATQGDLERVREWLSLLGDSSSSSSPEKRCLYGAVVTVTKPLPTARRGCVNMSVCVCSAELRWLHSMQHFLEAVALAACDATALGTAERINQRIGEIADSAYQHVVSKILPVAAGVSTTHAGQDVITSETALSAIVRRSLLHDDREWLKLQCITEPWVLPKLKEDTDKTQGQQQQQQQAAFTDDGDGQQPQQQQQTVQPPIVASPLRGVVNSNNHNNVTPTEIAVPILPLHALPPAPLQSIGAAIGTSSAQSLSSENCGAAHLSSLIGTVSELGFAKLIAHVLLQHRVLVICRGGGGSRAAQTAMAIGSLFSFFDDAFFSKRVMPYCSVATLDLVSQTTGVVAGTVNPIFESKFGNGIDCLVDLDQRCVSVPEPSSSPNDSSNNRNSRHSTLNPSSPNTAGSTAAASSTDTSEPETLELSSELKSWTEDFGRELRTMLQRRQAAAMSSGNAMLQRNEETSVVEDELRLRVAREISILLWRLTRANAVPRRMAESRIYMCGKWLGRGLHDATVFGLQVTRLLLPLDDKVFLDEAMVVSFLQGGVRQATTWTPEDALRVVATSPRALQCLSALCCHANSVVRLLASILLGKLRQGHKTVEDCAAQHVNMFLHFAVDAAGVEFKAQTQAISSQQRSRRSDE